jgi:DNA-binding MarR family transcriptional regulator
MSELLPDEDYIDLVHTLMFSLKASMRSTLEADETGLAPMEARALHFLQSHPGCPQSEFVLATGRDKAQVTRLFKPLVERGLVATIADESDRRLQRLWLTESGSQLQRRISRHRTALARKMLSGLNSKERVQAAALLRKMIDGVHSGEG